MAYDAAAPRQGTRAYRLERTQAIASMATVALALGAILFPVISALSQHVGTSATAPATASHVIDPDQIEMVQALTYRRTLALGQVPDGWSAVVALDSAEVVPVPPR